MNHSHGSEVLDGLREPAKALRTLVPDAYTGFVGLAKSVTGDGALPGRIKELIALAVAVGNQCDGCIASHARSAAIKGATPQEAAEAIAVTFLMVGGPGTVYGPRAFDAFMEFHEKYKKD